MTLDEKIKNNIKLTEKETKELLARIKKQDEEYRKAHPLPPKPVPEKSEEQKILDGDIKCPKDRKVVDGKIVYKTPAELYADKVWTKEQYSEYRRGERDGLLNSSDVYMLPDFPISAASLDAVKKYRQQLRDLPQQKKWPAVDFPELPEIKK